MDFLLPSFKIAQDHDPDIMDNGCINWTTFSNPSRHLFKNLSNIQETKTTFAVCTTEKNKKNPHPTCVNVSNLARNKQTSLAFVSFAIEPNLHLN